METFIDFWNEYKKSYKYGIDYIEVDCDDYIAIVSINFNLLKGIGFLPHCYTNRDCPFVLFTNAFYFNPKKPHAIKIIMVGKEATIKALTSVRNRKYQYPLAEFTYWISQEPGDDRFYGLHNHNNDELTRYIDHICDTHILPYKKECYKYFHKKFWRYNDKIRKEFKEHKKNLLETGFNNITKITECFDCFSWELQKAYKDGFANYCFKNKIL